MDVNLIKHYISQLVSQPQLLINQIVIFLLILFSSFVAVFVVKKILINIFLFTITHSKIKTNVLKKIKQILRKLSYITPPLIFYSFANFITPQWPVVQKIISNICLAFIIIVVAIVIHACLDFLEEFVTTFKFSEKIAVKSVIQVIKIAIYLITFIIILATLLNKNPVALLSGIGALTAVLLLVFKDTILGFVASVQLSALNLVKKGDWIEVSGHDIDGEVMDINLTTIKIQNWDKTISTIPTYKLTTDSFKNWKGMTQAKVRRIKRNLYIDSDTIKFCPESLMTKLEKADLLKDYLTKTKSEIDLHNKSKNIDLTTTINGRRLTNIGLFRNYVLNYLKTNKFIDKNSTCMVRLLEPTPQGLPIQIYAFSNNTQWVTYEAIQSDIFDHLIAVLPEFELKIFQTKISA